MRSFSVGGGVSSKLAAGPKHVWRAGMRRRRLRAVLAIGVSVLVALASAGTLLATGRIIMVNRNAQGALAAGNGSTGCGMSTDGRYVAFISTSSQLVPNDTNGTNDVFVFDRVTNAVTRESVASDGSQQVTTFVQGVNEGGVVSCSISGDGRYVTFTSSALGLGPGQAFTNTGFPVPHLYLRDRQTGVTTRLVKGVYVITEQGPVFDPSAYGLVNYGLISGNGRFVQFTSANTLQLPRVGDHQMYVLDLNTGNYDRVTVNNAGVQADGGSVAPVISADGRYVAYLSSATNLVPNDTNAGSDYFLRDRQLGTTERLSVSTTGAQSTDTGLAVQNAPVVAISDDGRFAAFVSGGANLVTPAAVGQHIYLRDRQSGTTSLFGQSTSGQAGNGGVVVVMSGDARYLAFVAVARLTADDPGICGRAGFQAESPDLYVLDRTTGQFSRDVPSLGCGSAGNVTGISADGRFAAFSHRQSLLGGSDAPNLNSDVYLLDRLPAAPVVTGISPASGPTTGNISVTVTGQNLWGFGPASNTVLQPQVRLGGVALTSVSVIDELRLTGVTSARPAGIVDVVLTSPDGQTGTLGGGYQYLNCSYAVAPATGSVSSGGGTVLVTVTTQSGCPWTVGTPSQTFATVSNITGNTGAATGSLVVTVQASASQVARSVTVPVADKTVTVAQGGTCNYSLTAPVKSFPATAGTGELVVAATSGCPWNVAASGLTFTSPNSGTGGPASVFFSMPVNPGPIRTFTAAVRYGSGTTATTTAAQGALPVFLTQAGLPTVTPPFGAFDTPAGDATVLAGSIALTGWTLDDIGVERVELWRDLQPGETTPPFAGTASDPRNGKVFIANATFVDGARPDIEALHPTTPFAYRAGWGSLLLTWGLWNQGNGTYKLYAYAFDQENTLGTIGTKTIIVSNNAATKPFGSIDTPAIGGNASGPNFGWALTPKVNGVATCKIQAGGVQVSIDSGPLQPVVFGGNVRSDIAGAFTGFSNSAAAGGHFIIDWSTLTTGAHTIGWLITDDCNRADGVGSRFFNVTSGTNLTAGVTPAVSAVAAPASSSVIASGFPGLSVEGTRPHEPESQDPITVARGYGELPEIVIPGDAGSRTVDVKQGERIEIRVPRGFESAYQLGIDGRRRALPTGATWDAASGTFYWQPAPAFLGRFRIVFTNGSARISVRVVVTP